MKPLSIFVINLDRRPDRLAEFDAVAKTLGLEYRRIAAVDALKLDPLPFVDWWRSFLFEGFRPAVRTQIGAYLSHRLAWQTMVDEGIPQALILEDDVVPAEFDGRFLSLDIKEFGLDQLRVEILDFKQDIAPTFPLRIKVPKHVHGRLIAHGLTYGAAAYLLTCEGARKCLSNQKFWHHIDHYDCLERSVGLKTAVLTPPLFKQSESPSDNHWHNRVAWTTLMDGLRLTSRHLTFFGRLLREVIVRTRILSLMPWPQSVAVKSWLLERNLRRYGLRSG